MENILFILIGIFGSASYAAGTYQMLRGHYKPSIFSRVVWVLLAINSFVAVLLSNSSKASVFLAGILLSGNFLICLLSFWKGSREFGRLEYVCLGLLALSGVIWIIFDAPLLNLGLGLFGHLVGAAPTYKKVWRDPESESAGFWSLFFIASVLSIAASYGQSWQFIIFPIYYALFDGSMFALCAWQKAKELADSYFAIG